MHAPFEEHQCSGRWAQRNELKRGRFCAVLDATHRLSSLFRVDSWPLLPTNNKGSEVGQQDQSAATSQALPEGSCAV